MPDEPKANPPKNLAQIKPEEKPAPQTAETKDIQPPTQAKEKPSDTNPPSPTPSSPDTQPSEGIENPQEPESPSLEEKISHLTDQGPITTLINEQLASRIEQKIEQKLDHELQVARRPDTVKWIMITLGIALLIIWIAWSGQLIFRQWF